MIRVFAIGMVASFGVSMASAVAALEAPGCLDGGVAATVAAIDEFLTLKLTDGREVRIPGLDPVRSTAQHPQAAELARAALQAWLVGPAIRVAPVAAEPDRWGRTVALVFAPNAGSIAESKPFVSVTEAMLGAGLARARPDDAVDACWSIYLALDKEARNTRAGLWADPDYAVLSADDRAGLAAHLGLFAIVEGQVGTVHEGRARTYVRLGQAGRAGFAIAVQRRALLRFTRNGMNPQAWIGRRVRVRGVLDDRWGLQIELESPQQIELIDP